MLMPCPACYRPMVAVEFRSVETDFCPACGGLWLDRGELGLMLGAGLDLPAGEDFHAGRRSVRRCPHCEANLLASPAPGRPDVEIDHCPHGHGLWLDHGELAKLVAARAGTAQLQALAAYCEEVFGSLKEK